MANLLYYNNFSDTMFLRKYNGQIDIFFDASDILSCIKGMYDFYQPENYKNKFQYLKFEHTTTLVQALTSIGLLGNSIQLLPPHQAEFLSKLLNDYNLDYDSISYKNSLISFLENIIKDGDNINDFEKIKNNTCNSLKILAFMNPFHWKNRLYYHINSDNKSILINEDIIIESELDELQELNLEIYHYLEVQRDSNRTINNINDALSLVILANKIKITNRKLASGEPTRLPLFFDSSGLYQRLLNHNPNLKKYFTLRIPHLNNPKEISAIRECEFFLCYSLYVADEAPLIDENAGNISRILPKHSERLHELESFFISQVEQEKKRFNSPYLSKNQSNELEKINENLKEYVNYEFIVTIVIPCFTSADSKKFLYDLKRKYISPNYFLFKNNSSNESYTKEVLNHLKTSYENINSKLSEYKTKYDFLYIMTSRLYDLHNILIKFDPSRNIDNLFHTVNLTRFFIPSNIESELTNKIFNYNSLQELKSTNYILNLSNKYRTLWISPNSFNKPYDSYEILSLIWLTSRYHFAYNIFKENVDYPTSLLMMFGANFIRDDDTSENNMNQYNTRIHRVNIILSKLEQRSNDYRKESNKIREFIEVLTAISYLRFQIISLSTQRLFTKSFSNKYHSNYEENKACLEPIDEAFNLLIEDDSIQSDLYRYLYVINLYIYYNTEIGGDYKIETLKDVVYHFSSYEKPYQSFWHYRYEDTLARYYYRKACMVNELSVNSTKIKKDFVENALKHAENALNISNNNLEFKDVNEISLFKIYLNDFLASLN